MYGSIFAACGAALALSIAAITGAGGARTQPPVNQPAARAEQSVPVLSDLPLVKALYTTGGVQLSEQEKLRLAVTFMQQPASEEVAAIRFEAAFKDAAAQDVFEFVGKLVKRPVQVYWASLGEIAIKPDTKVNLQAKQAGVESVLRAVSETSQVTGAKVDWRITDGVLEIAGETYFDRREVKLTIYDISPIIAARIETYNEERAKIVEEVTMLLREFVYAEGWRENGGNLARLTVVGDRMFIEAPERYHTQIKWMLEQLPSKGKHAAAGEPQVRAFALKFTDATQLLEVLKKDQRIKTVNFTRVVVDAATNSIIAHGTQEELNLLAGAIERQDTEDRAAKLKRHEALAVKYNELVAKLDKARDEKNKLEADAKAPELPEAKRQSLRNQLEDVQKLERSLLDELQKVREQQRVSQKDLPEAVFVTGAVSRPGVYAANSEISIRRLLAAAGGVVGTPKSVEVTESKDGESKVVLTFEADDLERGNGPDPMIQPGQMVTVR